MGSQRNIVAPLRFLEIIELAITRVCLAAFKWVKSVYGCDILHPPGTGESSYGRRNLWNKTNLPLSGQTDISAMSLPRHSMWDGAGRVGCCSHKTPCHRRRRSSKLCWRTVDIVEGARGGSLVENPNAFHRSFRFGRSGRMGWG